MKRSICFFLLSFFLFSCSSTELAIETPTNTSAPPTATPTITRTPTIAPTITPEITDISAWLDEQTAYWVKELGYTSWQELLDDKIYGPGYDDGRKRGFWHPEVAWTNTVSYGYVLGVQAVPITGDSEWSKYGTTAYVLEVAGEGADGVMPVVCGLDTSDGYAPICPDVFWGGQGHGPDYQSKEKLPTAGSLEKLVGRRLIFRLVSQASQTPERIEAEKLALIAAGYEGGYPAGYNQQIIQRGKWADLFWLFMTDENLAPQLAERWWHEGGGDKTPDELKKNKNGMALQQYYMKQFDVNTPFMIVDLLSDDSVSLDDVKFR